MKSQECVSDFPLIDLLAFLFFLAHAICFFWILQNKNYTILMHLRMGQLNVGKVYVLLMMRKLFHLIGSWTVWQTTGDDVSVEIF